MSQWTHLEDTTPRARKPYQCYLCCGPIAIGEQHVKRAGIWEGEPISQRMHTACEKLTHKWDEGDWESFSPGDSGFREELEEAKRKERNGTS